jgi:hypothetical protein
MYLYLLVAKGCQTNLRKTCHIYETDCMLHKENGENAVLSLTSASTHGKFDLGVNPLALVSRGLVLGLQAPSLTK